MTMDPKPRPTGPDLFRSLTPEEFATALADPSRAEAIEEALRKGAEEAEAAWRARPALHLPTMFFR